MKRLHTALVLTGFLACLAPISVSSQKTTAAKEPTVQEIKHFADDDADVVDYNATLRNSDQEDLEKSLSKALKSDDKEEVLGALRLIEHAGSEEYDRHLARHLKSEDEAIAEAALNALISSSSDKAVKELIKEWKAIAKENPNLLIDLAKEIQDGPVTEKMLKSLLSIAKNNKTPEEEATQALDLSKHMIGRVKNGIEFEDASSGLKQLKELEDFFELRGQEIERDTEAAPLFMPAPRHMPGLLLINNNYLIPKGKGLPIDLNDIVLEDDANGIHWKLKLLLQGGKNANIKIEVYFPVPNRPATRATLELTPTECISTVYGRQYKKKIDALDNWVEFEFAYMPTGSVDGSPNYLEAVNGEAVTSNSRYGPAFITTEHLPTEMRILCYRGSVMVSPGEIKEISELPK